MSGAYDGCGVPPAVYDIGFGWDPGPELERLLFVARLTGLEPRSALELGCGTGRLLRALRDRGVDAVGLDLSPCMGAFAESRSGARIAIGDMGAFQLGRTFDLIYSSANTIRHVRDDASIAGLWRCVAEHLVPGGVCIVDLELGIADEARRAAHPAVWSIARGGEEVRVTWRVAGPPTAEKRRTQIEWVFEWREGARRQRWAESYELRAYDADEFVRRATSNRRLATLALYELRDPYLLERTPQNAMGRVLAAFVRDA